MCKATYFAALLLGLGVLMQRLIAMDGNLNNMDVVFGAELILPTLATALQNTSLYSIIKKKL